MLYPVEKTHRRDTKGEIDADFNEGEEMIEYATVRYFIGKDEISREAWERLHPQKSIIEIDGVKYNFREKYGSFMIFKIPNEKHKGLNKTNA